MDMLSLHPSQHYAPTQVDATDALVVIQEMLEEGVNVNTRTFHAPTGANVTVFWTTDGAGQVATVWEHAYVTLSFNASDAGAGEESAVLQEADNVTASRESGESEGYAVGE